MPGSSWRALAPPPLFLGAQPPQQGAGAVWLSGALQEFIDTAHTAVQARGAPQRAGRTLRAGHPPGGVSGSARGTGVPGIYGGDFTSKGSIAGSRPTAGPALKAF